MTAYALSDPAFRVALHEAAGKKCVWCNRPVAYYELHIDHLIYKTIDDEPYRVLGRLLAGGLVV
jgi:hypothetical protein